VIRSLACAAGAAALVAPVKEAAAKMAQKAAEYQGTPKGDQQCSNCSLFEEPNACQLVDGEVSPTGWCKFWVKKPG
jgi:high potential iron-sulfur protein